MALASALALAAGCGVATAVDPGASRRAVTAQIERAAGRPDFELQLEFDRHADWLAVSTQIARCAPDLGKFRVTLGRGGEPVCRESWEKVRAGVLAAGSERALVVTPTTEASPASSVDPFWACERTSVPQPTGVAAAWSARWREPGNSRPRLAT